MYINEAINHIKEHEEEAKSDIVIYYHNKYGDFNFVPLVYNMNVAKVLYLNYVWWGFKDVQICVKHPWTDIEDEIIWETPQPVFPKYEPVEGLPF